MKWIVIIFLVVMAGCAKSSTVDTQTITTKDIYTGSDGLLISFLPNAPPDEVFEDSYAPLGLRIENKGAYNIQQGNIVIALENDYMDLIQGSLQTSSNDAGFIDDRHLEFDLAGKGLSRSIGDQDILTVNMKIHELETLSQTHDSNVAVTACYEYLTFATETVCLDTDVYNVKNRAKGCTVADVSLTDQGAPIAVTKIQTKMLPQDFGVVPQFIISIENKGSGLVFQPGKAEDACSSEKLDYTSLNKVNVQAYLQRGGDTQLLQCSPSEGSEAAIATLKDGSATVRCVLEEGISEQEGTFSTPLSIEIQYGYTTTISKRVTIKAT